MRTDWLGRGSAAAPPSRRGRTSPTRNSRCGFSIFRRRRSASSPSAEDAAAAGGDASHHARHDRRARARRVARADEPERRRGDQRRRATAQASTASNSPPVRTTSSSAATLTDREWTLAPLWNDADLFSALTATVAPPSALDRAVRPWAQWIPFALLGILVLLGVSPLWQRISDWRIASWIARVDCGGRGSRRVDAATPLALRDARARRRRAPADARVAARTCAVPSSCWRRSGSRLHVVDTYYDLGFNRMQLPMPGNDWWQFQRFAYRIYMQGYWLEGGEPTFWFQPLYRWIAGALHLLFGQSQIGENYWDAVAILIIALFSFEVVRQLRGFRWGILRRRADAHDLSVRSRSRASSAAGCRRSRRRDSSTWRRCASSRRARRDSSRLLVPRACSGCSASGRGRTTCRWRWRPRSLRGRSTRRRARSGRRASGLANVWRPAVVALPAALVDRHRSVRAADVALHRRVQHVLWHSKPARARCGTPGMSFRDDAAAAC